MTAFRWLPATLAIALLAPAAAKAGDGSKIYSAQCGACHQAGGAGVPGQFPKLSGRLAKLAATPEGRKYSASVVMYGLNGKIIVEGKPYIGVMPGFSNLSNADLADLMTYVTRQGATKPPAPFTAAEIASYRRKPPPPAKELRELRASLEAQGLL